MFLNGVELPNEGFVVADGPNGLCGRNSGGNTLCITEQPGGGLEIEMTSGPYTGRKTKWDPK